MSFIDKFTEIQKKAISDGDVTLSIHLSFILSRLRAREEQKRLASIKNKIQNERVDEIDEEQDQLLNIAGA